MNFKLTSIFLTTSFFVSAFNLLAPATMAANPSKASKVKTKAKTSTQQKSKTTKAKTSSPKVINEEEFMTKIQKQIFNVPNTVPVEKDTKTIVLIKISGAGELQGVTVTKSSGQKDLDESSLNRVRKGAPFGPMPAGFKDGLNLTYTFEYRAPVKAQESVDTGPYMDKLASKVSETWHAPEVEKDCSVKVSFVLKKDGTIDSIKVARASGFEIVDQTAIKAISRAAPFGPLPDPLTTMPVNYMFAAGPKHSKLKKYQWNGTPLEKANWQISRGGFQLKPLDVSNKVENKVASRKWKIQDEIDTLKGRLATAKDDDTKADILINIGRNYKKINDFKSATKSFEEASAIFKSENSANEAILKAELAEAYARTGDNTKAEKLFSSAVETLREHKETSKNELKQVLTEYARTLYKLKRVADANKLYAEIKSLN